MGLLNWARRRETPAQKRVFRLLDTLAHGHFPVILGVHHLLLAFRNFRKTYLRQLISKVYYEPLLRLSCADVGGRLMLFENMPKLLGSLDVHIGSNVGLEGEQVWIGAGNTTLKKISIGDNSYLGYGTRLVSGTEIVIGQHVQLANFVLLNGYDGHPLDPLARARHEPPGAEGVGAIAVGDYAWIGNHAIVLKGVTIGRGAVVASGAIVTKDVPELTVVGGNPAKPIRTLPAPIGWVSHG